MSDYLPDRPPAIPLRRVPAHIWERISLNFLLIARLFIAFEDTPTPAKRGLPSTGSTSPEQRAQAKEIFELAEKRIDALETRATRLLQAVGLIAPIQTAVAAFVWQRQAKAGDIPSLAYWMFVVSFLALALAGWAAIRGSDILKVTWPGPSTVLDEEQHIVRDYDIHRDTMLLLCCAFDNFAIARRRFDFLKAGTSLVVASVMFVLGGASVVLSQGVSTTKADRLARIAERLEQLQTTDNHLRHQIDAGDGELKALQDLRYARTTERLNGIDGDRAALDGRLTKLEAELLKIESEKSAGEVESR